MSRRSSSAISGPDAAGTPRSAAGAATTVAAVVPKLLRRVGPGDQSSISTTPARHSSAYSSRNGTVSSPVTASVNGSGPIDTETPATAVTVEKSGIQTS